MSQEGDLSGRVLGEFVLRERIGAGGFGAVYRAEQPILQREAVVKIALGGDRLSAEAIQTFLAEARLASRIDHPFAAHVYAFGAEPDGTLWIAMELVRGTPLSTVLSELGPMPLARALTFITRLSEVVHAAHEAGVVHRDLKPSNVMVVSRAGTMFPKLLDLGIARDVRPNTPSTSQPHAVAEPQNLLTSTLRATRTLEASPSMQVTAPAGHAARLAAQLMAVRVSTDSGSTEPATPSDESLGARARTAGTPLYMAPEQWVTAHTAGPSADIYALGILAYECLTGAPPFTGSTVKELAVKHARTPPPPLPQGFPPEVTTALHRAMAKRAADRYPTALAFAAALRDGSGIEHDAAGLVTLDEVVREDLLLHAPQPIAEAIAALDGARTPAALRDAVWRTAQVATQYVGVLALAARARSGPGRTSETPVAAGLLSKLSASSLDAEGWWRLARELVAPYAGLADAHPLPELVNLFFDGAAPIRHAMDSLLAARATQPAATAKNEDVRAWLAGAVPALAAALTGLRGVLAYTLAVPRERGRDGTRFAAGSAQLAAPEAPLTTTQQNAGAQARPEAMTTVTDDTGANQARTAVLPSAPVVDRVPTDMPTPRPGDGAVLEQDHAYALAWMGVRQTARRQFRVARDLPAGRPVLLAADGALVVSLHPFVQAAQPMPGAPEELFWLDGKAKAGALLAALPSAHIRTDPDLWRALGLARGSETIEATTTITADVMPYRGLSTFTQADAGNFFGREREVEAFVNRLSTAPWIAVVGPSGAGKSSFVQAGVLPALGDDWTSVVVRPGATPIANLAAALAAHQLPRDGDALVRDPHAVARALFEANNEAVATGRPRKLLLVIDQFEELFTMCLDADGQRAFAETITKMAVRPEDLSAAQFPLRVVITMRDDFLVRAAQLAALREALSASLQILTTPDATDLLRILIEPARRMGFRFEDEQLPNEMVAEVANQPAALALLSFTAAQLWQFRDREMHVLPRKAYRALGGVGGALAQHAEATLDAMPPSDRLVVRELFRHLVTADGTRATMSRAELLQVAGGAAAEAPLEQLIHARLLTASEHANGGEAIEVVHEALLAAWPRLVGWRHEDAENARLRDQLRVAAKAWQDKDRVKGLLWRGDLLTEYALWRARYPGRLTAVEDAFANASLADARRIRRWKRGLLAAAFVALTVALVIFARLRGQAESAAVRAAKSEATTQQQLLRAYVERARRLSLDDDSTRALWFLQKAIDGGLRTPEIEYLAGQSIARVDSMLRRYATNGRATTGVDLDKDEQRLLAGTFGGELLVWAHDQTEPEVQPAPYEATPVVARWRPQHPTHVFGSTNGGKIFVWDVSAKREIASVHTSRGLPFDLFASADGKTIVWAARNDGVWRWDVGTPEATRLAAGDYPTACLAADGYRVALLLGTEEGSQVEVVDLRNGARRRLGTSAKLANLVSCARHTDLAAIGTEGGEVIVFSLTSEDSKLLGVARDAVDQLAWSDDGKLLAAATSGNDAMVFEVATGKVSVPLSGHLGLIRDMHFVDGGTLATASFDGTVRWWDVVTGMNRGIVAHGGAITELAFAAKTGVLMSAGMRADVSAWRGPEARVFAPPAALGELVSVQPLGAASELVLAVGKEQIATVTPDAKLQGMRAISPTARIATDPARGEVIVVEDSTVVTLDAALREVAKTSLGHVPVALCKLNGEWASVDAQGVLRVGPRTASPPELQEADQFRVACLRDSVAVQFRDKSKVKHLAHYTPALQLLGPPLAPVRNAVFAEDGFVPFLFGERAGLYGSDGAQRNQLPGSLTPVSGIVLGQTFWGGGSNGTLVKLKPDGTVGATAQAHASPIYAVAAHVESATVATLGSTELRVWSTRDAELLESMPTPSDTTWLGATRDGYVIATPQWIRFVSVRLFRGAGEALAPYAAMCHDCAESVTVAP